MVSITMPTIAREREGQAAGLARIYFVPFEVVTLNPIKRDDIEDKAFYKIAFASRGSTRDLHPFVRGLRAAVRAQPAAIQLKELAIRLKLVLSNETYFVDTAGGVLEAESGQTFRLTSSNMKRLGSSIPGFQGVVDLNTVADIQEQLKGLLR